MKCRLIGDGSCNPSADCRDYAEDGGDCAQTTVMTLPFTATGPFSRAEFVGALKAGADYLQEGNIEVRVQIIRHTRTHSVGKYQSCMF